MLSSLTDLLCVVLLADASLAVEAVLREEAAVSTSFGLLVGNRDALRGCNSWLGVPYAQAPVGDLRFAGPKPWTRVYPSEGYNAKDYGAVCPQLAIGDEDCLFLNVWSPYRRTAAQLSVMVWIHGGAFHLGAASSAAPGVIPNALNTYDGCGLSSRHGVVVASMNYRMGPFGFLTFLTDDAGKMDANFGMRDQRSALQWLQHELPAFGGDPSKVTIFGESAGGISVFYHLAAPLSKGLFRAAISESGWPQSLTSTYGRNLSQAYGASLNCSDLASLRSCLMGKDTKTLMAAAGEAQNPAYSSRLWGPVVDGSDMPELIQEMYISGKTHQVPVMAGTNTDEWNFFFWPMFPDGMSESKYLKAVYNVFHGADPTQWLTDAQIASVLFLYGESCTSDKRACFTAVLRDFGVLCGTHFAAQWHSLTAPFYLYRFNHNSSCNALLNKAIVNASNPIPGSIHMAELAYVFGDPLREACLASPEESSFARRIQSIWTNFAKYLEPKLTSHARGDFPKYTNDRRSSKVLQTPADIIETDYRGKYCSFLARFPPYKTHGGSIRNKSDITSSVIV